MSTLLVSRQEASKRLGISRVVFTKLVKAGKLPGPFKDTGKYVWPAVYEAVTGKVLQADVRVEKKDAHHAA